VGWDARGFKSQIGSQSGGDGKGRRGWSQRDRDNDRVRPKGHRRSAMLEYAREVKAANTGP